MLNRKTIYDEIDNEREYQDKKWGGTSFDDAQTEQQWIEYIKQYAIGQRGSNNFRERMIKVAALAVAAIESYDRKESAGKVENA